MLPRPVLAHAMHPRFVLKNDVMVLRCVGARSASAI